MGFEIRPEPVRTRFGLWPVAIPVVIALVLVGIALANPLPPPPPPILEATTVACPATTDWVGGRAGDDLTVAGSFAPPDLGCRAVGTTARQPDPDAGLGDR